MMPQFDTFSFFSQLFWVFLAFTYLYLSLCFYLLPAIAAVLKTRAKKSSQTEIIVSSYYDNTMIIHPANSLYLEALLSLISNGGLLSLPMDLNHDIEIYSLVVPKKGAYIQFNFLILNQFKTMTFFA